MTTPTPGPIGLTFLQLAQRLRSEVGANGTGPATVISQTGEYQRIVDWIADADQEICQEFDDWKFMIAPFSITTSAGVGSYAPSACTPPVLDLRIWRERTIRCYPQATGKAGEGQLSFIDFEVWDATYNLAIPATGTPQYFTYGDANELLLGPVPNGAYVITGKYDRAATRLVIDTDTPRYPAEFHMLPVYLAMMKYGRFTGAGEVYNDGERLYEKMMARMKRTQRPRFNSPTPLV